MTYVNRGNTPLNNEQLRAQAPSVFAEHPWEGMSAKYAFIPTINIVDKMRAEGFVPVSAEQSRARIAGKGEFTRHQIRFRDMRGGDVPAVRELGTVYPELVLTNSHDGASAYKLDAGLFRLVCLNGMVVASGGVDAINVRHSGQPEDIIEASFEMVEQFPKVIDSVEKFGRLQLTAGEQEAYATSALALRYDEGKSPIEPRQLVAARRAEDVNPTLWNSFNKAQEYLTKGGLRGRSAETGRQQRVRAVTGIAENTRLNKALWMLTEEMAKLKGVAVGTALP